MVDSHAVCCMCGDVGFAEKLFRCSRCSHRFQHSYCSNNYSEASEPIQVCSWCQREEKNPSTTPRIFSPSSGKSSDLRSAYCGDNIKQSSFPNPNRDDTSGSGSAEKITGKTHSPRPTTRRYKLLKDVMC
ncbi:hypothetical protein M569_00298 [Genlisea aurea]|uniref:PHD-type zinc finger plants domain-containing protein n=1 Tax=Genlisea aurea TaxID=192259 RepID=S8ENM4_9LAMI|nr:hypothetical protein M569_00298 [Genlisea aurea]